MVASIQTPSCSLSTFLDYVPLQLAQVPTKGAPVLTHSIRLEAEDCGSMLWASVPQPLPEGAGGDLGGGRVGVSMATQDPANNLCRMNKPFLA